MPSSRPPRPPKSSVSASHVERLDGGDPELAAEFEQAIHHGTSVTSTRAEMRGERRVDRGIRAPDREREVAERAALDVVDAAVDELELESGARELEEDRRLRGIAVAERDRDDATRDAARAAPSSSAGDGMPLTTVDDEALRRRVLRVREHVEDVAVLDHAAAVHDGDLRRDRLDDVHLVRDDDDRDPELAVRRA